MSRMKCSECTFANFRFNDAPVGSGRSTFLCTKHNEYRTYGDTSCGEWESRYKETQDEVR